MKLFVLQLSLNLVIRPQIKACSVSTVLRQLSAPRQKWEYGDDFIARLEFRTFSSIIKSFERQLHTFVSHPVHLSQTLSLAVIQPNHACHNSLDVQHSYVRSYKNISVMSV